MITANEAKQNTDNIIKTWFKYDMLEIEKEINIAIKNGQYNIIRETLEQNIIEELKKLDYKIKNLNDNSYIISWK